MSESESNPDPKNHWRALAELLGAPPEEPDAVAQHAADATPIPEAAPEPLPPAKEKAPRSAPVRQPSDWYALACELGIQVEPPPEPAIVPAASEPPAAAERGRPEEASVHGAAEEANLETRAAAPDALQGWASLEDASGPPTNVDFMEDAAEALAEEPFFQDLATEDAAESSSELSVKRRRRRKRRRSRETPDAKTETEAEAQAEAVDSDNAAAEAIVSEVESSGTEEVDDEDTATPAESLRKRRSRRRRRRSAPEPEEPVDRSAESVARTEGDDQDDDQDGEVDDLEDDEGEDDEGGEERPKHKKIPTWEDAVSVIVSANMQSRTKSGGPTGRSRGPRRRRP